MKRAFDSSRLQRQGERQQAQTTLLETLSRLDQNLAAQNESQRQLLDLQARLFKHHAATTQQALADNRSSIDALLLPLNASLQEQQAGNLTLQGLLQEQQAGNQNLQKLQKDQLAANQVRQTLVQEAQAGNQVRQDILQAQQASGKTLTSALPALRTLNSTSEQTLTALGAIDARLQQHGEQNQQKLEDGRATRQAMEHLNDSNSRNLAAISGAAEQMASAAGTIGASAGNLQQAIADFKEGVAGVLGHLKQDLGETIGLMGSSFTSNMTQMSASLSEATLGISTAVNSLSNNVGQTMEGMKKSNEESLNLQRNAHASFQAPVKPCKSTSKA